MSKIIIDENEAKTTDISLTPNGTGVVEITGDTIDATVQLNSSTQLNNIKIKPPADSAGQNHTIILPDNDVDVDKYLKVKSVTGSGSTAVGQLEYATVTNIDTNNLNASNFTTGTLPNARMPSTLPTTSGFAHQLVTKYTVASGSSVSTIDFTGFDINSQYILVGKNVKLSSADRIEMAWLNSAGSIMNHNATGEKNVENATSNYSYYIGGGTNNSAAAYFYGTAGGYWDLYGQTGEDQGFIADFNTTSDMPAMMIRKYTSYYNSRGMFESWMSLNSIYHRIGGIRLKTKTNYNFIYPTEISLFKYRE